MAPDNSKIPSFVAHDTGTFTGKRGTKIFYQTWVPKSDPVRGVILIVHGIGEHSGRYVALASEFVKNGFAVGALDHRGHGKSEGKRVQVDKFDDLPDDVATFEDILRKKYPAPLPLFVLGHSMGGLISLRYLSRAGSKSDASGLVVSGVAAEKPEDISDLTITIGNLVAKILPDVGIASLQLDKISKDPEVVAEYKADPLVTIGKVRARMGAELIWGMQAVEKDIPGLTIPVLIMHGGDDVVTPPKGSVKINEHIGSSDKTLKIYDGLYHEIYNEPERAEVIADVNAWLAKHAS